MSICQVEIYIYILFKIWKWTTFPCCISSTTAENIIFFFTYNVCCNKISFCNQVKIKLFKTFVKNRNFADIVRVFINSNATQQMVGVASQCYLVSWNKKVFHKLFVKYFLQEISLQVQFYYRITSICNCSNNSL